MALPEGLQLWRHHDELQSSGSSPQSDRHRNSTLSKDQTFHSGLTQITLRD